MASDRSQLREGFAALLNAGLTGDGRLVQAVFAYHVGDFGTRFPVVVVRSGGTERRPFPQGGYPVHLLEAWVFVLYAALDEHGQLQRDAAGEPAWDEQDSENTLDEIEQEIRALVDSNPRGAHWKSVEYAGPSEVGVEKIGGVAYRTEVIPLRFHAF